MGLPWELAGSVVGLSREASTSAVQVFDFKSYGGQPNVDITQALTKAWTAACAVAGTKVVISTGTHKLGVVTLLDPCKGAIEFNLQGTLEAPSDVASFKGKDFWDSFQRIGSLTVSGDDCISIGDGTQDVTVNQVTCGPGLGISIGSLGRYQNEQLVSGIRVIGGTLSSTTNDVRINMAFFPSWNCF
nr:polygalacturonase [Quercus suber]